MKCMDYILSETELKTHLVTYPPFRRLALHYVERCCPKRPAETRSFPGLRVSVKTGNYFFFFFFLNTDLALEKKIHVLKLKNTI